MAQIYNSLKSTVKMLSKPGSVGLAHYLEKLGKIIRVTKEYLGSIVDYATLQKLSKLFGIK